jgi:OTU domain-containing protein 5
MKERDFYSQYISEDFDSYISRKRKDRVYGNHVELQAISELYNRRIEIFDVEEFVRRPDSKPRNLFQNDYKGAPIRLSYHNQNHYNSIFDPNDPRIGEGLLPGFKTREQIEADLVKRVKEITDRDAVEMELRRLAESESVKDDEERFLREIEEKQVRELLMNTRGQDVLDYEERQVKDLLSLTRPTDYDVDDYDVDYSSDTEEKLIERVKWESLKDQ